MFRTLEHLPCGRRHRPHLAPRPGLPPARRGRPRGSPRARRPAPHPAAAGGGARRQHGLRPRGRKAARAARPRRGAPRRRHARARLAAARRARRPRPPDRPRRRARRRDGARGDGSAAAAARGGRPAGGAPALGRPGDAARGARGAARGRARRRGGPAPRLRVVRGPHRGRGQRRLPPRHELDPRDLPGPPRALPPDRRRPRGPAAALPRGGAGDPRGRRGRGGGRGRRPRGGAGVAAAGGARVSLAVLSPREASSFARLADAVAMPVAPMPEVAATDAVAGFDGWLARAPRINRLVLRAALLGLGVRLRAGDRGARAEALRRLATTRVPAVAHLLEALRASAAAAYYGDEDVMRRLGYDARERVRHGRAVRAAAAAATAPAGAIVDGARIMGERIVRADACVIGSGAGGAVVAKELAEAGLRVVLLEEGEHVAADAFTARPRDMLPRLYRDAAQHATVGRPPILLPLGRAVGGTTLVNSGTCFRTPAAVLERWRRDFGLDALTPDALAPHVERVERELNVTRVPPELAGANAQVARRGAERLGRAGGFVQGNARGGVGSRG